MFYYTVIKQVWMRKLQSEDFCALYLEVFDLLHYNITQLCCRAVLLLRCLFLGLTFACRLLLLLLSLDLLLLEELEHLEDLPEKFIDFDLHALAIQRLEAAVHPPGNEEVKEVVMRRELVA